MRRVRVKARRMMRVGLASCVSAALWLASQLAAADVPLSCGAATARPAPAPIEPGGAAVRFYPNLAYREAGQFSIQLTAPGGELVELDVEIPQSEGRLLADLAANTMVLEREDGPERVRIRLRAPRRLVWKLQEFARPGAKSASRRARS